MLDNNWETLNGPVAQQIEVLNATNQINVLEGLIAFLLAHRGPANTGAPPMPDETALCFLHHAGTLFLLAQPGCYRNIAVDLRDEKGVVIYEPPPWQSVDGLMKQFFRQLSSVWRSGDALDASAYALWAINWIHPFRNGNGRTARAFSYACLCLHLGAVLPGRITIIDQIMTNRDRYQNCLRAADDSLKAKQIPDLGPMKQFLFDLLQAQIASAAPAPA